MAVEESACEEHPTKGDEPEVATTPAPEECSHHLEATAGAFELGRTLGPGRLLWGPEHVRPSGIAPTPPPRRNRTIAETTSPATRSPRCPWSRAAP